MTRSQGTPIKKTSNPFMVTSNQSYGLSLVGLQEKIAGVPISDGHDFDSGGERSSSSSSLSFLYRRESDRVGEGIEYSDSSLAAIMATKLSDSAKAKGRGNSIFVTTDVAKQLDTGKKENQEPPSKEEIERALASYKHNPKEENPLYSTTANEFGRKKPSKATYVAENRARSQQFSASFNGTMYSDEGLAR